MVDPGRNFFCVFSEGQADGMAGSPHRNSEAEHPIGDFSSSPAVLKSGSLVGARSRASRQRGGSSHPLPTPGRLEGRNVEVVPQLGTPLLHFCATEYWIQDILSLGAFLTT